MQLLSPSQVKAKEVEILDYIVHLCQEHGLRYYLSYGSLLGAVRHKGFIPWDDDIDISMPRADYEQLLKVMLATPHSRFVTLTPRAKGYPYHYAKVVDLSTRLMEEELDDFAGNGLWVDIFPLDGVNAQEPTLQKKMAQYFNSCRASASFKQCPPGNKPWKWRVVKMIGTKAFARLVTLCSRRKAFDGAQYVAHMPTALRYLFPRRLFDEVVKVEFEGRLYDAPAAYDEYLTILYGDYMQIPPEDQRITHCVKAVEV
ncbi:MAG: LicD family protein [Bacteroidales bacterium]|nr:LicD family protein [Bacteroidales bacterium]